MGNVNVRYPNEPQYINTTLMNEEKMASGITA